jgi:hypothetical protein
MLGEEEGARSPEHRETGGWVNEAPHYTRDVPACARRQQARVMSDAPARRGHRIAEAANNMRRSLANETEIHLTCSACLTGSLSLSLSIELTNRNR